MASEGSNISSTALMARMHTRNGKEMNARALNDIKALKPPNLTHVNIEAAKKSVELAIQSNETAVLKAKEYEEAAVKEHPIPASIEHMELNHTKIAKDTVIAADQQLVIANQQMEQFVSICPQFHEEMCDKEDPFDKFSTDEAAADFLAGLTKKVEN
jgi:hypothetical protein